MSIERISPETLHQWLQESDPPAVVDVRDEDRIGGHVANSIHSPASAFSDNWSELEQELRGKNRVVFYCQLSQIRGPTCAKKYFINSTTPNQTIYVLNGGFSNWAQYSRGQFFTDKFLPEFY